jgi:hypothetical protein
MMPRIRNGSTKCRLKKRVRVAFATENPPQTHSAISSPTRGTADTRLVITVAPQKLI